MVFVCPSSLLQYLLFVLLHTPLERYLESVALKYDMTLAQL